MNIFYFEWNYFFKKKKSKSDHERESIRNWLKEPNRWKNKKRSKIWYWPVWTSSKGEVVHSPRCANFFKIGTLQPLPQVPVQYQGHWFWQLNVWLLCLRKIVHSSHLNMVNWIRSMLWAWNSIGLCFRFGNLSIMLGYRLRS